MQGQPNMTGTDSGVLSGLTTAEMFMNMSISKGPKEFSIQNEQEFPALPTSTQPREEQLSNVSSDIQASLQVILQHWFAILLRIFGNLAADSRRGNCNVLYTKVVDSLQSSTDIRSWLSPTSLVLGDQV